LFSEKRFIFAAGISRENAGTNVKNMETAQLAEHGLVPESQM
jgi:hypothetical protein